MKKRLALLLTLLLICCSIFIGCKKPTNNDFGGVTYVARTGEMYSITKEDKTRIKISYTPGYGDDWIKFAARSFLLDELGKDYYFVLDSDSELTTGVSSKLESGLNLSDVYFPLASNWYNYAALGYLENLDDLYNTVIPGETKTVLEKINGSWKTYGLATNNGEQHQYVFPGNENITGIVYNKTMFDKYKWQVPETVEDLKNLCAQIVKDTKGTIAPFVYPGTIPGGYWDFIGTNWWLQVSGVDKLNEFMAFESSNVYSYSKPTDPSYGKLKMLETFYDVIVENRKDYTLKGSASKNHELAQISFVQGQAAMIPNGNWIEKESLETMKDEVRMMYTPRMEDAQKDGEGNYINYVYTGQPDYMFIPAKAKNKNGAKAFLSFMCKDEMLIQYTSKTGTPRPFAYDIASSETSDFIKSCLDIWSNSTIWFENSTSKLWTAGKTKKFQTNNPYTTLLANSDTITPIGWCASDKKAVETSWATWLSELS